MANDSRRRIRRDLHGRGVVGPIWPHSVPKRIGPDKKFQAQISAALSDLDEVLGEDLNRITVKVEQVPGIREIVLSSGTVPLGRIERGNPNVVVLYQRAIELRSASRSRQFRIIKDVLAELLGLLLGKPPQQIDPTYEGPALRG
ncbi:MAG: hypothetical protein EBS36_04010 [Actinobacteria bacterium]|nr:hypothetical protein [Actinomycetota bacterium]NBY15412.1 hypothetical protein [Actinomycetota bacterium]